MRGLHPAPSCSAGATPFLCSAKRASVSHSTAYITRIQFGYTLGVTCSHFCQEGHDRPSASARKNARPLNEAVCLEGERGGARGAADECSCVFPLKAGLEQHPGALLLHFERASKAKQSRRAKNRRRRSLIRTPRPPQTPGKKSSRFVFSASPGSVRERVSVQSASGTLKTAPPINPSFFFNN